MGLQRIRLRSGEFPSADRGEALSEPIPAVGGLGGEPLPRRCRPELHRPSNLSAGHTLRHVLTLLSLVPIRWAELSKLQEDVLYAPDLKLKGLRAS